ncbi:MAG: hypothetical protein SGARI_005762 [Bacillariaceae sp.]
MIHRPFGITGITKPAPNAEILLAMRGGDLAYDDDDSDEYDQYDDDDEADTEKVDHSLLDLPPPESAPRRRPPPSSSRQGRDRRPQQPPHQRQKPIRKTKKGPHWSQKIATQSIQMTGKLAWNTLVKQPGKLAYNVIRPKYVDIRETDGLWRLEQQVTERGDRIVASVATIELQARPRLVVIRKQEDGKEGDGDNGSNNKTMKIIKEPYTFTKKKLSGSFQTQFVAPAFLVGENQMRLYGYRGTWQRKLADKRVIKLVGKIYQVHKQRFGKQRNEYVFGQAVGTFVARRRIRAHVDDEMDEDEDDEYDDDGDEYDEEEEWEDVDEEWEEGEED